MNRRVSPQSFMFLGNTQNNEKVIQTRMDTDRPTDGHG